MFFPIGDNNIQRGSKPVINYILIALNVVVFLYQVTLNGIQANAFVFEFGSIPNKIVHGTDLVTLFTCMFLHGGWMHLLGNMLFLWVFGDNIESTIGSFKYLLFYIAGGVVASLTHAFFSAGSTIPCVGASGAIAAVLGAYLIMFPKSQIKILFLLFLTTFSVSAVYFLGFWIVQQFMNGIGSLGTAASSDVAYWAHLGGFAFGIVCGFLFKKKAQEMVLI